MHLGPARVATIDGTAGGGNVGGGKWSFARLGFVWDDLAAILACFSASFFNIVF